MVFDLPRKPKYEPFCRGDYLPQGLQLAVFLRKLLLQPLFPLEMLPYFFEVIVGEDLSFLKVAAVPGVVALG